MQVTAQSWEGLAASDDERYRIAATAEGGIWLLRTPRPGPVAEFAGTRSSVDTSRRFDGAGPWPDAGLSSTRLVPVLDADIVRQLEVGQASYLYRGGVTYVQVKRLTGRQAALAPAVVASRADGVAGASGLTGADGAARGEAPTVPLGWPAPFGSPAPAPGVAGMVLPDASEVLDEAFGARRE